MFRIDHDNLLRDLRQAPPLRTDQRNRLHAVVNRPIERLHQVWRIATDAQGHNDISRTREILQLLLEDIFVGVVVPERGDPTDIIVQR